MLMSRRVPLVIHQVHGVNNILAWIWTFDKLGSGFDWLIVLHKACYGIWQEYLLLTCKAITMGRRRTMTCIICLKTMRGDHLKIHMKKHENKPYSIDVVEIVIQTHGSGASYEEFGEVYKFEFRGVGKEC